VAHQVPQLCIARLRFARCPPLPAAAAAAAPRVQRRSSLALDLSAPLPLLPAPSQTTSALPSCASRRRVVTACLWPRRAAGPLSPRPGARLALARLTLPAVGAARPRVDPCSSASASDGGAFIPPVLLCGEAPHPPDLPRREHHLDPARVVRGPREQARHLADGLLP
jgi:hypothetical protein